MEPWMKPMLCVSADDVPIGDYALEPKLDGFRFIMHNTGRGVIAVAGRNASVYSGRLPYLETELAECLPPDTCLDGELVGSEWGDVQSVLAANGPHIPTVKNGGLRFVAFDVLRCNGEDTRGLPWHERRAILDAANLGHGYISRTDVFEATPRALQVALATGFEGVVCKIRDSRYTNGRSASWVKIKAEFTCEAMVTGWETGTGSNANRLGALHVTLLDENDNAKIGQDGKPVTTKVGGGLSDDIRQAFSNLAPRGGQLQYPAGWAHGTIIEVKHNGEMASGKVRHPSYVRKRTDKQAVAKPRRPAPQTNRQPAAGAWVRNYGAMGGAKLVSVIGQLERGYGPAVDRVTQNGGDLAHNLARAREAARSKGLIP